MILLLLHGGFNGLLDYLPRLRARLGGLELGRLPRDERVHRRDRVLAEHAHARPVDVLLAEHGADEAEQRLPGREALDHVGAALYLPVRALLH